MTENTIKLFIYVGIFIIIKTIVDGKPKKRKKSYKKNDICIIKILFNIIKFFFNIIKEIIIDIKDKPKYTEPIQTERKEEPQPKKDTPNQTTNQTTNQPYKNTNRNPYNLKTYKNKTNKNIYKEKVRRGELYEDFIANHYRELGYTVTENGKENGCKDGGIDLIAKKDKEAILIQCKDWDKNGKWKIRQKNILEFRSRARDFVEANPKLKSYLLTARYTISEEFIDISAIKHIEEIQKKGKRVDYEIIKIPSV